MIVANACWHKLGQGPGDQLEEEAAAVALEDADMPDEGGDEPIEPDAEDESGPGEENLDRKDISGCCNCACEVVFFFTWLTYIIYSKFNGQILLHLASPSCVHGL